MGNLISIWFSGKRSFSVDQIPDLDGQVVVVTGGNAGIGKETCKALLNKNAKVYLAARNKTKADEAIEWLKNETGGKVAIFLELDLANLDSIRKSVEEFKSKEQELHILFNNAGVYAPPLEQKTANGYDMQFGTNTLGHYFFTILLLPILIHTAKHSTVASGHARAIHTSSAAVYTPPKGGIVWETLGTDEAAASACTKLGKLSLYAQSKIGNVLVSNELARRYSDQGIISVAVHPGMVKSEMSRHLPLPDWLKEFGADLLLSPTSDGTLNQLYAGTMPEGEQLNGKFLIPWARLADPGPAAMDVELAGKLWAWCEEQVKGH